jgi:hypothetical protein
VIASEEYGRQICPGRLVVQPQGHQRHWLDNPKTILEVRPHGAIGCHLGCRKLISLTAGGFPWFAGISLPSVNQGAVRSVDDRNLSMQRNVLECQVIDRTGKKARIARKKLRVLPLGHPPFSEMMEVTSGRGGTATDRDGDTRIEAGGGIEVVFIR